VANVSQLVTIDRVLLNDLVSLLATRHLAQVLAGIDVVLGRVR
jgi:hypothetical protein